MPHCLYNPRGFAVLRCRIIQHPDFTRFVPVIRFIILTQYNAALYYKNEPPSPSPQVGLLMLHGRFRPVAKWSALEGANRGLKSSEARFRGAVQAQVDSQKTQANTPHK